MLRPLAGDGESALIGQQLGDSLSVRLTAGNGTPLVGETLTWTVGSGGGWVSPAATSTKPDGVASTRWTLGTPEAQLVSASVDGMDLAPVSFSSSAVAPAVAVRYDGTSWRTELADTNATGISLLDVWGTSATDLFAIGRTSGGALTLRLSGGTWSDLFPGPGDATCTESAISGRASTDVYVAGACAQPPWSERSIGHHDGQSWTWSYYDFCSFDCLGRINSSWLSSGPDAYAVGDYGLILRSDGSTWSVVDSVTDAWLFGVCGTAADHVLAVGSRGTILLYDGTSWSPESSGVGTSLRAVWGTSASDVYAVGDGGTILHFDGTSWSSQTSGC